MRAIFFRRTYKQLEEVIGRAKELFEPHGAIWKESSGTFTFPNGAWVKMRYLDRDEDAANLQGHSYTDIVIEEAGTFPSFTPIAKLLGTLRSAKGIKCQMFLTGNPGGPGASWIRARYIDPAPQGWAPIKEVQERVLTNGQRVTVESIRIYIPSRLTDNQILMQSDPNYVGRLMQTGDENQVRAWLDGDFYVTPGAFFDCFSQRRHVLPPATLPPWWLRFRAGDWGSARPFAFLWIAMASEDWQHPATGVRVPKGALVVYREWYGIKAKPDGTIQANVGLRMFAEQVGNGIAERDRNETIHYGVLDPSAFIVDGGPSIAERIYTSTGGKVAFRRADNKRVATVGAISGWDQVRSRLTGEAETPGAEAAPMLFIFSDCHHLLRTLPMMQHDPDNPEDLDTTAEDHACFAAGTLVETENGPEAIESLVGRRFRVRTAGGYANATAFLTRRSAHVRRYHLSDGSTVECTPDHRFVCADGGLRTIRRARLTGRMIVRIFKQRKAPTLIEFIACATRHLASKSANGKRAALASVIAKLAGENYLSITTSERLPDQDVYCLRVPSTGLFVLSNGLVCSNCDALRYGCMSRPYAPTQPAKPKPMTSLKNVTMNMLWHDQEQNGGGDERI